MAVPARSRLTMKPFIVATANARPEAVGQPFTRWSIRKLVDYLADNDQRVVKIGRERLRQLLVENDITFQRTKTWKESNDPDRDAKLDRIEHVLEQHPDRTFAFDEFGPLAIRPGRRRVLGRRQVIGRSGSRRTITSCMGSGSSTAATRSATTSCGVSSGGASPPSNDARCAQVDPGAPARRRTDLRDLGQSVGPQGHKIREWAARNRVELCFTPTYSSWANPIEAHFGPLREFVLNNSNHPNHVVLTRRLHAHLRWRNDNARAPELLAAQRRERARVRAEKGRRWGRPASRAA